MFEMVVMLSKIKIPYLKVKSLLLVSNEIVDSLFVPEIPTLHRDFYLFDKLPKSLAHFWYCTGTIPESNHKVRIPTLRRQFRNCTDSHFAPNI